MSIFPRPYIWRLTSLSLVIWPSVWPFDQGRLSAAIGVVKLTHGAQIRHVHG